MNAIYLVGPPPLPGWLLALRLTGAVASFLGAALLFLAMVRTWSKLDLLDVYVRLALVGVFATVGYRFVESIVSRAPGAVGLWPLVIAFVVCDVALFLQHVVRPIRQRRRSR